MLDKLDKSIFLDTWMRPPQWRWKAVMSSVAGDRDTDRLMRSDRYLKEAVKFYRSRRTWFKEAPVYRRKHPTVSSALDLYLDNKPSGWKWYLEALILSGLNDEDIIHKLGLPIPPKVLDCYRKLFFDISIYNNSEIAIDVNVFGATRAVSTVYTDCDYSWKLIAYTWGADIFLNHVNPKRRERDGELYKWFESVVKERMLSYSFHLSTDIKLMYNQQALDILTTAKSFWDVPDIAMEDAADSLHSSYLDDLLNRVDITMTTVRKKDTPENEPRAVNTNNRMLKNKVGLKI